MEPKVTGLSPMTGPPGTKITVRGENLGQSSNDILKLTINGADCLPYLEWKSPKKIITRCSKAIGSGEVVVTTKSGGTGSCDVQFNCYEEIVGPTDESAVWVEEMDYQTPEKESFNITSPSDEYSGEISSSRFKPQTYLLRNHQDANLEDLLEAQKILQAKLANKSDSETISSDSNRATILKSNLPIIMECLLILERLSKVIATSRDTSIESMANSIRDSLAKTHELFDPLLEQNNMVQSIESAMQVFKRSDGTFFDLRLAIENSIETKNYDSIVKEISNVTSRLRIINIDADLKEKIERDVANKVDILRSTINKQLHESCRTKGERNIDEVKKLITQLNRLGGQVNFDVWIALEEMSGSLTRTLSEKFTHYLELSLDESKDLFEGKNIDIDELTTRKEPPPIVEFVKCAIKMFDNTYYDILALGQSYFDPKDEFACREELRSERLPVFYDNMISNPIIHLSSLLRLALINNTGDPNSIWPDYEDDKEMYINWLRYVLHKDWLRIILQSVINCHLHLTKASIPSNASPAIDEFKRFVTELRRQCMEILFKNASLSNRNLHDKENWVTEVDDLHGSITELPLLFESNVIEILRFAKDAILKPSQQDEVSILKNVAIQAELKELAYGLINSFHTSLDNALSSSKVYPAEKTLVMLASDDSIRKPSQLSNRLLITICNYQFTRNQVFPRLKEEFKRLLELNVEKVFDECSKKYRNYIDKTMNRFCAIKCEELIKKLVKPNDQNSNSIMELQRNLMIVNSQIFLVAPQLVDDLMPEIINKILMESNRLIS